MSKHVRFSLEKVDTLDAVFNTSTLPKIRKESGVGDQYESLRTWE